MRSYRVPLLLAACVLLLSSTLVLGVSEGLHHRGGGSSSSSSSRQREYDRAAAGGGGGWGLPGWALFLLAGMSVAGIAVCGCMVSITAWLYAQYKMARGTVNLIQFGWEVVQKLMRGESPLPRAANGKLQAPEALISQLPLMNTKLGRYIGKYGMEKAEEIFDQFFEQDASGHYHRRASFDKTK